MEIQEAQNIKEYFDILKNEEQNRRTHASQF